MPSNDPSKPGEFKTPERCPHCGGTKLVRRGKRAKKFESAQLWLCKSCTRAFTDALIRGKSYPARAILDALCWYHQGYTAKETIALLKRRHGYAPHENAIGKWLKEYRDLCTYKRLRAQGRIRFRPTQLIRSVKLFHRQVYKYSIHRGKLAELLDPEGEHGRFKPIGEYLERMLTDCPHELFADDAGTARASQARSKFDLSQVAIIEKQNRATDVARLVLSTVSNNRLRHEGIQRFMLLCDSATVAVEVPVFLQAADFEALRAALPGFSIPAELAKTTTGHVDFLQIRNGAIHILDYKPDARTNRPIEQLTLYAIALSRATGLRLYDFKCAWFNEETYCEFFPLHVVYKLAEPDAARLRPAS